MAHRLHEAAEQSGMVMMHGAVKTAALAAQERGEPRSRRDSTRTRCE